MTWQQQVAEATTILFLFTAVNSGYASVWRSRTVIALHLTFRDIRYAFDRYFLTIEEAFAVIDNVVNHSWHNGVTFYDANHNCMIPWSILMIIRIEVFYVINKLAHTFACIVRQIAIEILLRRIRRSWCLHMCALCVYAAITAHDLRTRTCWWYVYMFCTSNVLLHWANVSLPRLPKLSLCLLIGNSKINTIACIVSEYMTRKFISTSYTQLCARQQYDSMYMLQLMLPKS